MAKYKKIAPIKDKVHGYMHFAVWHRLFIDSPFFQHLHYISQNGAAYVAYPCNRNSRFSHSLGVAHLAGKMFLAGLSNSNKEHLVKFVNAMERSILEIVKNEMVDLEGLIKKYRKLDSYISIASSIGCFVDAPNIDKERGDFEIPSEIVIDICWFSLVCCALYHDVGHLPFSHSFEEALKEVKVGKKEDFLYLCNKNKICSADAKSNFFDEIVGTNLSDFSRASKRQDTIGRIICAYDLKNSNKREDLEGFVENVGLKDPVHELRGKKILTDYVLEDILKKIEQRGEKEGVDLFKIIRGVICAIYWVDTSICINRVYSAYQAMKYIYAGFVDADRIDYTLRDSVESGLADGGFDKDRIVNNMILFVDKSKSCKGEEKFYFGSLMKSLPSIDEMFHKRRKVYDIVVYHKCVLKANAIIKDVISRLIILSIFCSEDCNRRIDVSESMLLLVRLMDFYGILKCEFQEKFSKYRVKRIIPDDRKSIKSLTDATIISFFVQARDRLEDVIKEYKDYDDDIARCIIVNSKVVKDLISYFLDRNFSKVMHYGKNIEDIEIYIEKWSIDIGVYQQEVREQYVKKIKKCLANLGKCEYSIFIDIFMRKKVPQRRKEGSHKFIAGRRRDGSMIVLPYADLEQMGYMGVDAAFGKYTVHRNDFIIYQGDCNKEKLDECYKEFLKGLDGISGVYNGRKESSS